MLYSPFFMCTCVYSSLSNREVRFVLSTLAVFTLIWTLFVWIPYSPLSLHWFHLHHYLVAAKSENASQNFSSIQSLSRVWPFARQASLSITNSWSLLKLMSIESVMPSSHLILSHPFSSCPQSLPASESFPVSQLFAWSGQSTGVSALASFLPRNTQGWSPLEWKLICT